jgi:FkbM family methyltransferase
LSDLVSSYVRGFKHRGQLKVIDGLERLIGRRRWNVQTSYGFRIAVDINDLVQHHILVTGSWDHNVASALQQRWDKNDVFMDVGANIGLFSLLALRQRLRHVVAFEPLPTLADLLVANADSNGFPRRRLTVVRTALGSITGSANYRPGPIENSGQGRIDLSDPDSGLVVPITTIDTYLAANPSHTPTIMKLDVEGFEFDVLQGASKLFKDSPPHTIVFEAEANERLEILDRRILDLFHNRGYQITAVDPALMDTKANFLAKLP